MSSFQKKNKLNSLIIRYEKVKREIIECSMCFFYTHKDKFMSPKHKLLAFLVKANQRGVKAYWEVGVTTVDTCNIPAVAWQQCC